MIFAPELLQKTMVCDYSSAHTRVGDIGNAKLSARSLDDFADRRIVDVANARKQVVLDLEIQAAAVPRRQLAFWRKIHGGLHLVNGPFVVDFTRIRIRTRKSIVFHDVGELEDGGHGDAEDNMR